VAFLVRLLFWLPADAGGGWRGLRGTATGKCCGNAIAIAIAIAGVTAAASCQRCSKLQRKGRAMDGCSGRGANAQGGKNAQGAEEGREKQRVCDMCVTLEF